MMQLLRRWTMERSNDATAEGIYHLTVLVFVYFTHCLHATSMRVEEIAAFVFACSDELITTFRKTLGELEADCEQALNFLNAHEMYFSDAARDMHQMLAADTGRNEVTEQVFVIVCSSACGAIIAKPQKTASSRRDLRRPPC
jgi:hypothetical protein